MDFGLVKQQTEKKKEKHQTFKSLSHNMTSIVHNKKSFFLTKWRKHQSDDVLKDSDKG